VGNVAERCSLAPAGSPSPTFRKKFRNESVSGYGFLYSKTRNHRKTTVEKLPINAKSNNLLKTKRVLKTEI